MSGGAAPPGRALPGRAAPLVTSYAATCGWSHRWRTAPCGGRCAWSCGTRWGLDGGRRLIQRLVTRPHDVAAVYEFQQRLESVAVAAGAHSGLVELPDWVPAD